MKARHKLQGTVIFLHFFSLFQENSNDQAIIDMAQQIDSSVVWFKTGSAFAVVIHGHIFRQKTEFEAFFVYTTCFSVFSIPLDGDKETEEFPNRGALELLHW